MNLILLFADDFTAPNIVRLQGRRLRHMSEVQQPAIGDRLRVGLLDGRVGSGTLLTLDDQAAELQVELEREPPPRLPLRLILALPRPKMLKRTLQTVATLGVDELWLINAYRVDKSYWSTPLLAPEAIREQLILGLEQAGDTRLPEIQLRKRFKPFVEDELPALCAGRRALVAHPYDAQPCPAAENTPSVLAVGPEGGFIRYEVDKLIEAGMQPIHLGPRILRVETAVPVLLSRLFPI